MGFVEFFAFIEFLEFTGFIGLISGAEVFVPSRNDHHCYLSLFEERGRHSELSERPPQVAPLALSLWSVTLTSPSLIRLRVEALRSSTLTGSPSSPYLTMTPPGSSTASVGGSSRSTKNSSSASGSYRKRGQAGFSRPGIELVSDR